jgi:hypothetical protein
MLLASCKRRFGRKLFKNQRDDKESTNEEEEAEIIMTEIDGTKESNYQCEIMLLRKGGKDNSTNQEKYNVAQDTFSIDAGAISRT